MWLFICGILCLLTLNYRNKYKKNYSDIEESKRMYNELNAEINKKNNILELREKELLDKDDLLNELQFKLKNTEKQKTKYQTLYNKFVEQYEILKLKERELLDMEENLKCYDIKLSDKNKDLKSDTEIINKLKSELEDAEKQKTEYKILYNELAEMPDILKLKERELLDMEEKLKFYDIKLSDKDKDLKSDTEIIGKLKSELEDTEKQNTKYKILYNEFVEKHEILKLKEQELLDKERELLDMEETLKSYDIKLRDKNKDLESAATEIINKFKSEFEDAKIKKARYYKLYNELIQESNSLELRKQRLLEKEEDLRAYDNMLRFREEKLLNIDEHVKKLETKYKQLENEISLHEIGIYELKYNFENLNLYEEKLEEIRVKEKELFLLKKACICNDPISVIHSIGIGRSVIYSYSELMLKAFNLECSNAIENVNYKNIELVEKKLEIVFEYINDIGKKLNCEITYQYFNLKRQELYLVFEYQEKVYQEREKQRIIKEQIAEEEKAQKEFQKALIEAEKEAERYNKALVQVRQELERTTGEKVYKLENIIIELENKLQEAEENKRAISQAQITKSGHVYIISNIGSLGENIYKIGMTRRIDPNERIRELSSSSMPFPFDVHAMIFTENAPELELTIHKMLSQRRVNRVNLRKEFFEVELEEIKEIIEELGITDVKYTYGFEAKEYRQSLLIKQADLKLIAQ
ncbi:DUF4041 domain-containing protein [Clostridium cellulovorans]|uniref:Bacteriophage T5 Orf172 DNA-binding domain-containing protein n=1 Tax=Clostridium cellulovorans (strain ATCC 35296 / DSM 3052 / OCM 3 / 743B) TaxID=573061 RepID=D9SPZ7_CLOC7|nr:DUF4041 domain-containing protein [Clostridium cellulovorans]ADL52133.1 hypothetical protein Clocel_2419 [Clostridium cellulovorans 743B]